MNDNIEYYPLVKYMKYNNPKNYIDKTVRKYTNQRTLAVINTYIPEDNLSRYNTRSYIDHEYRSYVMNRLETIKFTLACYNHYRAGVDYDLVIVDNNSPSKEAREFLLNCGRKVIFRENTYYSFGAYRQVFEELGDKYDYFVFHEFDWCPSKDGWLKDLIDYWNSDHQIGMIGNLIEEFSRDNTQDVITHIIDKVSLGRKIIYNLDSEYLFVDKGVLNEMIRTWGKWNIFPCSPEVEETPVINELGLQQPILEMGYKLACYNDGKHTMFYSLYNSGFPRNGKWWHGFENLAPYVPTQTRLFVPEMNYYFKWYDHIKNNSFIKWD